MNLRNKNIHAYQKTEVYSATMFADPHALITQMFDGVLTRIAQAKGAISRKETANKAELIGKAIQIIGGLEGSLNSAEGGEISQNLSKLYEYMSLTLLQANIDNDIDKLDEVSRLVMTIKSGWVQIPEQLKLAQA